jgi:hypothetical protein
MAEAPLCAREVARLVGDIERDVQDPHRA